MPYVVQLDLGTAGARFAGLCDALDPAVETVTRLGAVPHLSLAIYDDFDLEAGIARLGAFAAAVAPLPLRLAGLGVFAGVSHVLFAAPVVTEALLALHRRFHDEFAPPGAACHAHYRPGAWVPHVTLALNLTGAQLQAGVAAIAPRWTPFETELTAVRLIRYHPVETLFRRALGAAASP